MNLYSLHHLIDHFLLRLAPGRPANLKLRTVISAASRTRVLQVQWGPPIQEKPIRLKYRVRWNLLLPPEAKRRTKRQYEPAKLEPVTAEMARELGIAEELVAGEENITKLNWESAPGRLRELRCMHAKKIVKDAFKILAISCSWRSFV